MKMKYKYFISKPTDLFYLGLNPNDGTFVEKELY
jgi:hypothetical protein